MELRELLSVDLNSWAYRNLASLANDWTPRTKPRLVTASDNVNPGDGEVRADATAGAITLTMESAVGCDGRWHLFKKIDSSANAVTLDGNGSETIDDAATFVLATQYTAVLLISNGVSWDAIRGSLATILGILGITSGGTGNTTGTATINANLTGPVTSVGNATTIVAPTYPLMDYGGLNFNGTTTYLDGNALTGIADSKKGTIVCIVRFANAASATERLFASTGAALDFFRTSTGNIGCDARNAAATQILNIDTTGTPCAAAGTYCIMVSYDLATAGSGRIYVNDVSSYAETTFTNDTIDYTVAEYSVGATVGGGTFFSGDMYVLWFTGQTNLEFNTESIRRRFIDSNNVPVFMGSNGELPFITNVPTAFHAYSNGSEAGRASWVRNRGSGTGAFVEKGVIAAPATRLLGQYAPISGRYTPTLTNVANLTSTAYECQYFRDSSRLGGIQAISGRVDVDPTLAATSTQLGISLPFASGLTAAEQCAGTAFAPGIAGQGAAILGDVPNDRAQMQWISTDLTNQAMYFTLTSGII